MTAAHKVIVTGATGFIGRFLTARLTAQGHEVYALARRAKQRSREMSAWIDAHGGDATRLQLIESDLTKPALGLTPAASARLKDATYVFHLGAVMQWGLRPDEATRINVDGTRAVFDLACGLPGLARFVLVTGFGVEVSPKQGAVPGGVYEQTKIEADRQITKLAKQRGVATTRVHPANVIGDSRTGEALNQFGFGDLSRRLAAGKLFAVPGNARTWAPLVTIDYLADFLASVPFTDVEPSAEYLVLDQRTPRLRELVGRVARELGVPPPRLQVPIWLAHLASRALRDHQMQESLYFLSELQFDTGPADRAAARHGLVKPDLDSSIARHLQFMARGAPS